MKQTRPFRLALLLCVALAPARPSWSAEEAAAPTFKAEEIDQLVAPIALYPDSLLAQVLMASTYPLEVVEAARWAKENPKVKDKALEDAMQKQTWDPSVKSLTSFPQVLAMMNDKLDWTQKLGDAFLAQQGDVMDAVQRLRAKAKAEGNLETTKEQKVTVEQAPVNVEQKVVVQAPAAAPPPTIIKIEPAQPQVVYVPTYNPTVVYGAWPYPAYPPYYYYPPGYVAATSAISFGVGLAVGSALWGGCHWGGYGGHNDVNINVNRYNNYNHTNISNNNWNHNVEHRKGVQYRDGNTQQRYGRGQTQAAKSREAFRGRAESGRRDLQGPKGDQVRRDLDKGSGGDRARSGSQQARRDAPQQRSASGSKPGASKQGASQRKPGSQQARQPQARAQQPSSRGGGGAFQGMNSGSQARQNSSRGQSSRQSARSQGGGGGSGGGHRGGGGRGR
jgi:uncharacterized membrane protein YgcG